MQQPHMQVVMGTTHQVEAQSEGLRPNGIFASCARWTKVQPDSKSCSDVVAAAVSDAAAPPKSPRPPARKSYSLGMELEVQ